MEHFFLQIQVKTKKKEKVFHENRTLFFPKFTRSDVHPFKLLGGMQMRTILKLLGGIRRVASGGQGGNAPRFSFLPPRFISRPPHGIFLGGRSCFFWLEKTLKFVISVRKSLRISAKTFFFFRRSPAFGRKKTLKFRSKKAFGNRQKPLPPI